MEDQAISDWARGNEVAVLTDREFSKFSAFIYEVCGIKLPPIKKTMLSARLNKRLRHLQISSFSEYLDYVMSPDGEAHELTSMIDVVSTNKTDFFREAKHFDVLTSLVLPEYLARNKSSRQNRPLRIWSAGCSSGEEPYTIAMVLDDFCKRNPALDYTILATDINTEVLAHGEQGVYANETVEPVPAAFRNKYLMRGKGSHGGFHRIVPELRRKVTFRRLNFMDKDFKIKEEIDLIFCRNVIIYFDRKTQVELFEKFYRQFARGGYLFTGHSESLEGIIDRMQRVTSAVYRCLK